jgi:O-methyltransferase
LTLCGSNKTFHVYDSFEGLPGVSDKDDPENGKSIFEAGGGRWMIEPERLINNFLNAGLDPPIIHRGWFGDIPDSEYPPVISFAYLDGDLYSSIMDGLTKIHEKMSAGGVIIIHDYTEEFVLPGVKRAVQEFIALHRPTWEVEIISPFGIIKIPTPRS